MADLADLLSTIYARAQQANQWPNVHRATAFAPFELGHKVSKESKTSNITSNISSNFSADEGYGRIGEALGKGINDAVMGFYVNPKMEANAERIKWETSPSVLMKRAQAAMEHIRTLPPDQQALAMQSPEMQSLAQAAKKYAPWLVNEQGGFNMPPQTLEQMKTETWNLLTPEERRQYFTGKERLTEAEIGKTGAQTGLYGAETKKTGAETSRIEQMTPYDVQKTRSEIEKILADVKETNALLGPRAQALRAQAYHANVSAQAELARALRGEGGLTAAEEARENAKDTRAFKAKFMDTKTRLTTKLMADPSGDSLPALLEYHTGVASLLPGSVWSISHPDQARFVIGEGIDNTSNLIQLAKRALLEGDRTTALSAYNMAMQNYRTFKMSTMDKGKEKATNPLDVVAPDLNALYDAIVKGR